MSKKDFLINRKLFNENRNQKLTIYIDSVKKNLFSRFQEEMVVINFSSFM